MSFKKFIHYTIFVCAIVAATVSCKKKKTETSYLYLDGNLTINAPAYVEAGTSVTISAKGVSHPKGDKMGVWWSVSSLRDTKDTLKVDFDPTAGSTYNIDFPADKLQAYTVVCGVFANGYITSTSSSTTITAVKGGMDGTGSITDADFNSTDPKESDTRGSGKDYFKVNINGTEWFRQNLAYEEDLGSNLGKGIPYQNCNAMTDVFGLYYTHEQAKAACPPGWELPSEEDWTALANYIVGNDSELGLTGTFEQNTIFHGAAGALMADALFNKDVLWEYWPQVNKTNSTKFSALPAGFVNSGNFWQIGKYAAFWSKEEGTDPDTGEKFGYYRYIDDKTADIQIGKGYGSFAASVRCIKK